MGDASAQASLPGSYTRTALVIRLGVPYAANPLMTKIRPSGTATVPAKTAARFMGFRVLHVPVEVQSGGVLSAGSDCSTLDSVGLLACP